ncbi:MAG: hypothetical protein ACIAQZ_12685 [Sedimentisphaeraceae bacterium JB056]
MQANPLTNRYITATMKFKRFGIYALIYFSLLFVTAMVALKNDFNDTMFGFTAFCQMAFFFLWPAFISSNVINNELNNKSYDFFRMLPLSAKQKTWAVVFGANIAPLILGILNLILLILLSTTILMPLNILALTALYICGYFTLTHLGLLSSTLNTKINKNASIGIFIAILLFFSMPLSIGLVQLVKNEKFLTKTNYFSFDIPVVLTSIIMMLAITFWAHITIVRKFTKERHPLFNRKRAVLFYITFFLLYAGFFIPDIKTEIVGAMVSITATLLIITVLSSTQSAPIFLEELSRKAHKRNAVNFGMLLAESNLLTASLQVALWAVSLGGILFWAGGFDLTILLLLLSAVTGFMFLIIMGEAATQYKTIASHIYYLAGTLAAIYLILPLILGGLSDNAGFFIPVSPIGSIITLTDRMISEYQEFEASTLNIGALISIGFNIFISAIMYQLLHNKYKQELNTIRKMLKN